MVELPWRERARPLYVISVALFSVALLWIGFGSGKFEGVHRVLMCATAVGLGYSLVLIAINTTTLKVDGGTLLVEHGPLPWRAPLTVAVGEVAALRCEPASGRLVLRTRVGEEHLVAEDLRAHQCTRTDALIRERLGIGTA